MRTISTTSDYGRGLIDGQVDILAQVVETLDSYEPGTARAIIDALLKNAQRRAAEQANR